MLSGDGRGFTVNDVAALARHASMSTSYKPALLKAIVRLLRAGAGREIALAAIGTKFVDQYWTQTVVFHLRQAPTIERESEVVRRIRNVSEKNGTKRLAELSPGVRAKLDAEMAYVLTINVLDRFHQSKPLAMPRLYDWHPGDQSIAMSLAAYDFVRANAQSLETIANHWWARYLEKVNMLAPFIIAKVERDGAQRGSLVRYLKILTITDEPQCFYCERALDATGTPHVDHVIPWSFLLADPLWDLVLACSACNLSKSDILPERGFIDKLVARGTQRAKIALPSRIGSPIVSYGEIDRYYDAALSVEWPSGWAP